MEHCIKFILFICFCVGAFSLLSTCQNSTFTVIQSDKTQKTERVGYLIESGKETFVVKYYHDIDNHIKFSIGDKNYSIDNRYVKITELYK